MWFVYLILSFLTNKQNLLICRFKNFNFHSNYIVYWKCVQLSCMTNKHESLLLLAMHLSPDSARNFVACKKMVMIAKSFVMFQEYASQRRRRFNVMRSLRTSTGFSLLWKPSKTLKELSYSLTKTIAGRFTYSAVG